MPRLSSPLTRSLPLAFALLAFAQPLPAAEHDHDAGQPAPVGTSAIAVLVAGNNSGVSGSVLFTQESAGVHVHAEVKGLTPGLHGFHVHEKGDLSKADLSSAGGHFNPARHAHGDRTAAERHAGDLGNLEAGADGKATADFVDAQLQLGGPSSIIGRSVIVHEKVDDLKSQPSGNAGGRIAGGVVGIVELKK